jgi:hypothetical protein
MAKRLFYQSLLLILILLKVNNAYAWYCNYVPTPQGYMLEGSLVCNGIDPTIALRDYWCVSYQPSDPICSAYQTPVCSSGVESQSTACPLPHYSGVVNKSRTYSCSSQSWSDWYEVSNNCTQDPPTCQTTTETRQLACQADYVGSITETRISSCPDPYGVPVFGAWVETTNTCVKSATNVTNVSSPVSPSSPLNPVNNPPPVAAPPQPAPAEASPLPTPVDVKVEQPKQEVKDTPKAKEDSPKETPKAEQKNESKDSPKLEVPKGKELVHGFGIVLSLEILNAPIIQQQQITDQFIFTEEISNGYTRNQNFLIDLIKPNNAESTIIGDSNRRFNRIRSSDLLQQDERHSRRYGKDRLKSYQ